MIVVLDDIGEIASQQLIDSPYNISFDPNDISKAICLIVRNKKINKQMILNAPKLKAIARAGVGMDAIDTEFAISKGISLFNAQGGNSVNAAETTIGLILALAHKITYAHTLLHHHKTWERGLPTEGFELANKTLGIVGCGNVGSRVAQFALAFNMNVLAYDPYIDHFPTNVLSVSSLENMLPQCDILTVHVPLNTETTYLISEAHINLMKDQSYLLNVARGKVVSEQAIINALKTQKLAGVALDVFEQEPLDKNSELFNFDNVILLPHLGGASTEARNRVACMAVEQILSFYGNLT